MKKKHRALFTAMGTVIAAGYFVIGLIGKQRMNSDQTLGCLVVGALCIAISAAGYAFGGFPYRKSEDRVIRAAFVFASLSLAYSILQVPLWSLMAHQFPPEKFTDAQIYVVFIGALVSLFGPPAPALVIFARLIKQANKRQREELKRKREGHS